VEGLAPVVLPNSFIKIKKEKKRKEKKEGNDCGGVVHQGCTALIAAPFCLIASGLRGKGEDGILSGKSFVHGRKRVGLLLELLLVLAIKVAVFSRAKEGVSE